MKHNRLCPFTILIDQQEKLPYSFQGIRADAKYGRIPMIIPTQTAHLKTGDYTIAGLEDCIAIERKSLEDCFSTLGQARDRFERELERLNFLDVALVIVEADWQTILCEPPPHSRLNPKTIHRSIIAWQMRFHRVHWWTCFSRRFAEITTYRLLERYWKTKGRPGNVHSPAGTIDAPSSHQPELL